MQGLLGQRAATRSPPHPVWGWPPLLAPHTSRPSGDAVPEVGNSDRKIASLAASTPALQASSSFTCISPIRGVLPMQMLPWWRGGPAAPAPLLWSATPSWHRATRMSECLHTIECLQLSVVGPHAEVQHVAWQLVLAWHDHECLITTRACTHVMRPLCSPASGRYLRHGPSLMAAVQNDRHASRAGCLAICSHVHLCSA